MRVYSSIEYRNTEIAIGTGHRSTSSTRNIARVAFFKVAQRVTAITINSVTVIAATYSTFISTHNETITTNRCTFYIISNVIFESRTRNRTVEPSLLCTRGRTSIPIDNIAIVAHFNMIWWVLITIAISTIKS